MGFGGGGFQRQRQRPRQSQPGELKIGTAVVIRGLQSAAQHNHKKGKVSKYDPSKGRYTIKLDDGESLSIKRENLQQLVPNCRLEGLASKPELNGKPCALLGFNAKAGRYAVAVGATATPMSVKPANLRLPEGTSVQIHGLQSAAAQALNGTYGTVRRFDDTAGRYVVHHSAGDKKLKPENIVA